MNALPFVICISPDGKRFSLPSFFIRRGAEEYDLSYT